MHLASHQGPGTQTIQSRDRWTKPRRLSWTRRFLSPNFWLGIFADVEPRFRAGDSLKKRPPQSSRSQPVTRAEPGDVQPPQERTCTVIPACPIDASTVSGRTTLPYCVQRAGTRRYLDHPSIRRVPRPVAHTDNVLFIHYGGNLADRGYHQHSFVETVRSPNRFQGRGTINGWTRAPTRLPVNSIEKLQRNSEIGSDFYLLKLTFDSDRRTIA